MGSVLNVVASTDRRGAEMFAADLDAELRRRGIATSVVALTRGAEDGLMSFSTLGRRRLAPATLVALRHAARAGSAVVAHGSTTLPACAAALTASHVPFAYRSIGDPTAWSGAGVRRLRTALLLRRANIVVALWRGAADALVERHGVPATKIRVIPNGVSASRITRPDDSARRAARQSLGLPGDVALLGYVGSLTREKQVDALLAVAEVMTDVHLLVVGDGPEREMLERQAARVAPGRVHFVGVRTDATSAFAAADVVVLASRTEGMPAALIEAGLCSRPAVSFDVGAVSEVVVDGESGVLVPQGDVTAFAAATRRVLSDAAAMGAAAREHCLARYEIERVGSQWLDVLGELGHVSL